jgi:hypothetical protein
MIDTIATAGGFIFIAYVMGQVVHGNIERRRRIEQHRAAVLGNDENRHGEAALPQLDAELSLLMREREPGALVHSNVVDMATWKNSRA